MSSGSDGKSLSAVADADGLVGSAGGDGSEAGVGVSFFGFGDSTESFSAAGLSVLPRAAAKISRLNPDALEDTEFSIEIPELHKSDELGLLFGHTNQLLDRLAGVM